MLKIYHEELESYWFIIFFNKERGFELIKWMKGRYLIIVWNEFVDKVLRKNPVKGQKGDKCFSK